jgi:DNA-binding SARP family transcriptional activator
MRPSSTSITSAAQKATFYGNESMALYKVYFFGPFRIMSKDQPFNEFVWRRNKARSLLKWFLLNPYRLFSVDQLIALFWPGIERSSGLRNLHVTTNYLRHLLEPELLPYQKSKFIRRNKNNFYWFELDESWWADIFDIQYLLTAATQAEQCGNIVEAIAHYGKIARYCSRSFLPEDAYEDTFAPYRRQYERITTQVLESLIRLCSQCGQFDEVFSYSHQALLIDPYCEVAIKAIVNAYFKQGNITEATRKLDDFQSLLKEDLGLGLSEDILSLKRNFRKRE